MKQQIRWLTTFRHPIPIGSPWKPLSEILETVQTGDYIIFNQGSETTVNIRGSGPVILSIAGVGDLRGIMEGEHFDFIDMVDESTEAEDQFDNPSWITPDIIRSTLKWLVIEDLVLLIEPSDHKDEDPKRTCQRLASLREALCTETVSAWEPAEKYVNRFLERGDLSTGTLVSLLEDVGGFSEKEAECAAPVLGTRLATKLP